MDFGITIKPEVPVARPFRLCSDDLNLKYSSQINLVALPINRETTNGFRHHN